MTATPTRAMAISMPIARAISLPSNHLTIPFDTVMPAISEPQPNIMKPRQESLQDRGIETHHEFGQPRAKTDEGRDTAKYFNEAPSTITDPERTMVKRTPFLSRMMHLQKIEQCKYVWKNSSPLQGRSWLLSSYKAGIQPYNWTATNFGGSSSKLVFALFLIFAGIILDGKGVRFTIVLFRSR